MGWDFREKLLFCRENCALVYVGEIKHCLSQQYKKKQFPKNKATLQFKIFIEKRQAILIELQFGICFILYFLKFLAGRGFQKTTMVLNFLGILT